MTLCAWPRWRARAAWAATTSAASQPGKRADIALFDLRDVGYSGAGDALSALLLCAPTRVSTLVIEGRVVVEGGVLQGVSLVPILRRHRRIAAKIVGRPPLL